MLRGSLAVLVVVFGLAGCPGGSSGVGESCAGHDDCTNGLQCLSTTCVPRCDRAPDCGDGYACDQHGLCQRALGQKGDNCTSEVDCAAGLACQIDGALVDKDNHLIASCTEQSPMRASGAACSDDSECRNGTCALGRCIDLCRETRDCAAGSSCLDVPRVDANGKLFTGCMPDRGTVTFSIPVAGASSEILLPIPTIAKSVSLVMTVDDPSQKVGAASVLSPTGARIYSLPCSPPVSLTDPPCTADNSLDQFYANKLRHAPALQQSVLLIPSAPNVPIEPGAYQIRVSSFRANGAPGTAVPKVTAVVQLSAGTTLDLHFHFLDLDDHPCVTMPNNTRLDAAAAPATALFQDYLGQLRAMISRANLALGEVTFEDIREHPEVDGLDVADAGKLLALGKHATGINVFFVRSLSPIGIQAWGPNPGPAGLGGTPQSGVVIGLDTLCYRGWSDLARLTMHELARYMGLYHNVEIETAQHPTWRDPISDSDDSHDNLMYFSENGGRELSSGQRAQLSRSGVLR